MPDRDVIPLASTIMTVPVADLREELDRQQAATAAAADAVAAASGRLAAAGIGIVPRWLPIAEAPEGIRDGRSLLALDAERECRRIFWHPEFGWVSGFRRMQLHGGFTWADTGKTHRDHSPDRFEPAWILWPVPDWPWEPKPTAWGRPGEPLVYDDPAELLDEDNVGWFVPAAIADDLGRTRWAVSVPTSCGGTDLDWFDSEAEAARFCASARAVPGGESGGGRP